MSSDMQPQKPEINSKKLATHTWGGYSLPIVQYSICVRSLQAKLHSKITMLVKKGNRNIVLVI